MLRKTLKWLGAILGAGIAASAITIGWVFVLAQSSYFYVMNRVGDEICVEEANLGFVSHLNDMQISKWDIKGFFAMLDVFMPSDDLSVSFYSGKCGEGGRVEFSCVLNREQGDNYCEVALYSTGLSCACFG